MKIGFCTTNAKLIRVAYEVGFDYVEIDNREVYEMKDEAFEDFLALCEELPKGFMYASNGLVPGEFRLTGPDVNFDEISEFSEKSFAKLAKLGVKMLVFGSSKAKIVPEGFDFDEAMGQLVKVTRIFAENAAKNGQTVCIEPLRKAECNIINTAEDSIALAKATGCANVGGHVDYYHLMQNGEKMSKLEALAKDIVHTHIASPCVRVAPAPDDGADYKQFFDYLRRGGYDATMSYEGIGKKVPEMLKPICEYLKTL